MKHTDASERQRACNCDKANPNAVGMNGSGYSDGEDVIYEFTQAHPTAKTTTSDALKWAQSHYITDNADIAQALWRYHNTFHVEEDDRPLGGLTDG